MLKKQEILVLVDEMDHEIGTDTRENCHLGSGKRHRAYTVFLFHGGKLLLQQRSKKKTLWPGAWDVSFTSHVYPGETYAQAAVRKGKQELDAKFGELRGVYSFVYFAPQGRWAENEFCRLLVGDFDGKVKPNPDEISAIKWVAIPELKEELRTDPSSYTPWLKLSFEGFLGYPGSKKYGA
ncbi:MAG: isopentenyl-diphosphate delta-isomerase [Nitrososphaerota archaeon]|nr:isopentenyl-diphosphate delta-isomerase [Nitrososphaerota archaeon]